MNENIHGNIRIGDLFAHLKPFSRFLLKKWPMFLLASLVGAGLGLVYYYIQKPNYKAECTFVLEEKQTSLGGLGGLASQFGFDIGSLSGGGSLFSGENIFEILKSKRIISKVLLSKIDSADSQNKSLADLYIDFEKLKTKWKNKPLLVSVSFANTQPRLTPVQDTVLNIIYDKLTEKNIIVDKAGKKGNLIKVQVNSLNRDFARLMSQRIVEEAIALYIFIKVGNAQNNINKLQRKADSLQALLNGKSYVAASTQLVDANPGLMTVRVPGEIAVRDKTITATLYGEVIKNLEASKMILAQQTPVIQVIDYPGLTIRDNLKSVKKLVAIGVIALLFLFFFATLIQYAGNIKFKLLKK